MACGLCVKSTLRQAWQLLHCARMKRRRQEDGHDPSLSHFDTFWNRRTLGMSTTVQLLTIPTLPLSFGLLFAFWNISI